MTRWRQTPGRDCCLLSNPPNWSLGSRSGYLRLWGSLMLDLLQLLGSKSCKGSNSWILSAGLGRRTCLYCELWLESCGGLGCGCCSHSGWGFKWYCWGRWGRGTCGGCRCGRFRRRMMSRRVGLQQNLEGVAILDEDFSEHRGRAVTRQRRLAGLRLLKKQK